MRRALAAVLLGGALLATAACGAEADNAAAPSPSSAPDYSANTKLVCDALETVLTGKEMEAETTKALAEAVKGKSTEAEINKASVEAMKGVFTKWADAIIAEGAKAEDPQFKADVESFATALKAEVAQMTAIDDADKLMSGAETTAAGEKLDKYCA